MLLEVTEKLHEVTEEHNHKKLAAQRLAAKAAKGAAARAAAKGAAAKGAGRATECTCSSHRHKVLRSRSSTRNPRRLVHSWGLQGHTFLTYS